MSSPGYVLRAARLNAGLTRREVAEGICSVSLISQYETNYVFPPYKRIKELCERLAIDADLLQRTVDKYREIDRRIRKASRVGDFKTVYELYLNLAETELCQQTKARYISRAEVAKSVCFDRTYYNPNAN